MLCALPDELPKLCHCCVVPPRAQVADSHTATRGRNRLLNCVVSGDPNPTVSWYRNGTQLASGTKYMILENSSLWIGNVAESDAGDYSCVAVNEAGNDTATTSLIVYGKLNCFVSTVEPQLSK